METAEEMPGTPLHSSKKVPGAFSQNGRSNAGPALVPICGQRYPWLWRTIHSEPPATLTTSKVCMARHTPFWKLGSVSSWEDLFPSA